MSQWIDEIKQGYENRYEQNLRAIAEMAKFYNSFGYKMMILKGYGCSLNWPKPEHRPIGDIDIWLFGYQKDADAVLTKEKGIEIDRNHHHYTMFCWRGFTVENHYDFINVHYHKTNPELEEIFKELGQDDSHYVELYKEKVYLPPPNLFALFLLRQTMVDFASGIISLRQVLDWAFFVVKYRNKVDWNWMLPIIERFHMRAFFNCLNGICVEDLGFDARIFPVVQFEPVMKNLVLKDIISPRFFEDEPECFLRRLIFKYRRWKTNSWKHKLCYNESMRTAFWSGV